MNDRKGNQGGGFPDEVGEEVHGRILGMQTLDSRLAKLEERSHPRRAVPVWVDSPPTAEQEDTIRGAKDDGLPVIVFSWMPSTADIRFTQ